MVIDQGIENLHSAYERIIYACKNGFQGYMLEYGPVKLSVSDLCTLLPPGYVTDFKKIKSAHPDLIPGWLVDKVLY
jgi:hypothetical protein